MGYNFTVLKLNYRISKNANSKDRALPQARAMECVLIRQPGPKN